MISAYKRWDTRRILVLAAAAAFLAPQAIQATTINAVPNYSGTGTFELDNDIQLFTFTLVTDSDVSLFTTSWATGGFEPVLSLFKSVATQGLDPLLASDAGAVAPNCGNRGVDQVLGLCLDAYITTTLQAGNYLLALTQNNNVPNGQIFGAGFARSDDPNFTATDTGIEGYFQAEGSGSGLPTTGDWAVQILAKPLVSVGDSATPEPNSLWLSLTGIGLAGLPLVRRRRRA